MKVELTSVEARVLGALVEKAMTTPDQYPLSLNALVTACNQKSNRDPVMHLEPGTVQATLDDLGKRYLVSEAAGSRVTRYRHRLFTSGLSDARMSDSQRAVLCVLMLRGLQTPGELRTRTQRMCRFGNTDEVEQVLGELSAWSEGSLVARLPREPGKREARYMHLLCGDSPPAAATPAESAGTTTLTERVARLEEGVQELRDELDALTRSRNGEP